MIADYIATAGVLTYITMAIRDRKARGGRLEVRDLWLTGKDHAMDYLAVQKLTRKRAEAHYERWERGVKMAAEGQPQAVKVAPEDALDDSLEGLGF